MHADVEGEGVHVHVACARGICMHVACAWACAGMGMGVCRALGGRQRQPRLPQCTRRLANATQ